MDEPQEINAQEIMEQMREDIRRRRIAAERVIPAPSVSSPSNGQVAADLATLHSSYDVSGVHFTSHRRLLGPVVVALKRALRKLLTPLLERQVAYNAANSRVTILLNERIEAFAQRHAQDLQAIREQVERLAGEQGRLAGEQGRLAGEQGRLAGEQERFDREQQRLASELGQALQAMRQKLESLAGPQVDLREELLGRRQQALQAFSERVSTVERKLRRMVYLLTDGQKEHGTEKIERQAFFSRELEPEFDYLGFEQRVRGTEQQLRDRQRIYVEYFHGRDDVLDIGCGRGEFLELLSEAGIRARGVDVDLDMVLLCREKGLDVVQDDAFACLEALPDDSLGGIFAAQVIEHLSFRQIVSLPKLCHRKLRPGGVLILETLNPECLSVHYRWFWMDLTHTRLIHPETLRFLLESVGFDDVRCRFLPAPEGPLTIPPLALGDRPGTELHRFNEATESLNKLLFASTDYAVIGKK